jgi:CheY-like chemotaxis protein
VAYLSNAGGLLLKTKLRILLVEDNVADSVLIAHQLEESGFVFSMTRVQTEADFRRELEADLPDVILSDHGLPSFGGFEALEITRAGHPTLPFIFVSGSYDQEMVMQMYDEGATDHVFKRDLGDLKGALLHALEPPPEPAPPSAETAAPSAQPELALGMSALRPDAPVFAPEMGCLLCCPGCRETRDQMGRIVWMEDYCIQRAETVVRCQLCMSCELRS